ncbi:MAG TPA: phosphoglycerate kinase [Desulfomicrobiaceae bacterium]|nr:phosphoglycerate kinase [Desulfomicrobiaceae bacterium]
MLFLDQVDISGKRLLIRVDYNVPLDGNRITDDNRIAASLPTLRHALDQGASLVLCSHLGRPKGEVRSEFSLRPVAARLQELLGREVRMAPDCIGAETEALAGDLAPGQVLMLENLRFHAGETKNDPEFSRSLAAMGDVYVNDAFGVSHRAHASVVGVTGHMDVCCGGFLLKKEWEYLGEALTDPARPYVAIVGGSKVSSKLGILNALLDKVDSIIIGGAMANTFRKAQGLGVGTSLVENDMLDDAMQVMVRAQESGVRLYLPVDVIMGTGPKGEVASGVRPYQDIPDDEMILDSGPASHVLFSEVLKTARTVVWNGPVGAFENPAFAQGSLGLCHTVAALTDALTIVGGGDTGAIIHQVGLEENFSFLSTGGGSFLEFLEGRELPAFKALEECAAR